MLILTNSNPQSIDVMLCLYKEWHKLQIQIKGIFFQDTTSCIPAFRDTSDLYPCFFPLIRLRKVIHNTICNSKRKYLNLDDSHSALVIFDIFKGQCTTDVLKLLEDINIQA